MFLLCNVACMCCPVLQFNESQGKHGAEVYSYDSSNVFDVCTVHHIANVYTNQRDAQIIVNSLYFFVKWLYMFRTIISPKHVEPFNEKIKTIHNNLCISLVCIHSKCLSSLLHENRLF